VDLDHRVLEAVLGVEAVAAEAVAIRDPRLVDRIVGPRHDALHATAQHMRVNVRADTVMGRDERLRAHLPRPRAVAVRLVVQRADRAEVDDVAGKLVPQPALDVRADHDALGTADRAELLNALDLGTEAHAAGAVDAARHVGRDQGAQVLVLDDALPLDIARHVTAEAHREILQLALAALVADRAVERMVDQQELHRRLLRLDRALRPRVDLHAVRDWRRARGQRLRRLLDVDEAHPAV